MPPQTREVDASERTNVRPSEPGSLNRQADAALENARSDAFGAVTKKDGLTADDREMKSISEIRVGAMTDVLQLRGKNITDAGASYIGKNTNLTWLDLGHTHITDAGATELKHLHKLERLDLSDTKVTDKGLKELCGLTELSHLYVGGTRVSDASMHSLARVNGSLIVLDVAGTDVTDQGLRQLSLANKNLAQVNVLGAKVTEEGVREFQKALPECRVISTWTMPPTVLDLLNQGKPAFIPGVAEIPVIPQPHVAPEADPKRPRTKAEMEQWFKDGKQWEPPADQTGKSKYVERPIGPGPTEKDQMTMTAFFRDVNHFIDYRAAGLSGNLAAHAYLAPRADFAFENLAAAARRLNTELAVPHNMMVSQLHDIRLNNSLLQGSPATWTTGANLDVLRASERPVVEQFQNLANTRRLLENEAASLTSLTSPAQRQWLSQQHFEGPQIGLAPRPASTVPAALAEYEVATQAATNAQRELNTTTALRSIGTLVGAEATKYAMDRYVFGPQVPAPTLRTQMIDMLTPFAALSMRRVSLLGQYSMIVGSHAMARIADDYEENYFKK